MNSISSARFVPVEIPSIDTPSAFRPIKVNELQQALAKDGVFATYFREEMEGSSPVKLEQWLNELTDRINKAQANLSEEHKGCALIFRFRKAYGNVHHVALAAVWLVKGELQLGFAHQESIPDGNRGYRGRVFDTFDTRAALNGKTPPVLDSLRKQGLPDVAVRSCAEPSNVSVATWLSDPSCEHPYGFLGEEDEQGFPRLTCFSITEMLFAMVRRKDAGVDTGPTIFVFERFMRDLFGGDSLANYPFFSTPQKEYNDQELFKASLDIAKRWGDKEPWDVKPQA